MAPPASLLLPESPWLRYGLAEGALLAGKYRLQAILGEGGMGLVVAAHHEPLDRTVALKVLRPESAKDPVQVERFLREARMAANLRSEHVARVLDVGTLPTGAPFMVLEYLEGADLAQVLARSGRLPVAVACNYLVQACEAVAEAHASGIVHRDLKPDNLYLTTRVGGADLVKVLDFGVSKTMMPDRAALTTTGMALGSPVYMAPEQVRGSREVGPRADVWALGIVLYELLTGRLPFEAETLPDLCVKITQQDAEPIENVRAEVPAKLAAVVARCLEKEPAKRYFDAAELAEALAPFAPETVRSKPSGPRRSDDPGAVTLVADARGAPPMPPRRARLGIAAATVAVALAAAWLIHGRAHDGDVALSAVDAAMSASRFVQDEVTLAPETTGEPASPVAPPVGSTVAATAPPARSTPATPARAAATSRPVRPATTPAPAPAPPPADDIPAFR